MGSRRFYLAALAGLLSAAFPLATSAAVFTYDGFVFRSPGPAATPSDPDFPPLRTHAQVELFIDDSDRSLAINPSHSKPDLPDGFASGRLTIPGYLTSHFVYDNAGLSFLDVGTPGMAFQIDIGNHGPTVLDNPGAIEFQEREVVSITIFFSDIDSLPSTAGELVAAVSKPGAHGVFEVRMVDDDGAFYDVHVTLRPTVIPLPGALVLLGSAVAGFAGLRVRLGSSGGS